MRALEEQVAGLLGHEAAVFVPSGTMGNNVGLRLVAAPGSEVLVDHECHVVWYEMGALAALGGIQTRTFATERGVVTPAHLAAHLSVGPAGPYAGDENYDRVRTVAVAIENTHVRSGGRAWRLAELDALSQLLRWPGGGPALRRGAPVERLGGHRHSARRVRPPLHHALGLPVQEPGGAGGLARGH